MQAAAQRDLDAKLAGVGREREVAMIYQRLFEPCPTSAPSVEVRATLVDRLNALHQHEISSEQPRTQVHTTCQTALPTLR